MIKLLEDRLMKWPTIAGRLARSALRGSRTSGSKSPVRDLIRSGLCRVLASQSPPTCATAFTVLASSACCFLANLWYEYFVTRSIEQRRPPV